MLTARQFGKPLVGERLAFFPIDYPSTWITINRPLDALAGTFPRFVTTDERGQAIVTVAAAPGPIQGLPPARVPVFSQVYQLGDVTGWQSWGQVGPPIPPYLLASQNFPRDAKAAIVSVLVFNEGPPIANPTWNDVQAVFSQYARIFPAMKEMIDLSSEQMVRAYARQILAALVLPIDDARHMPATRDLPGYHRTLMVKYLQSIMSSGSSSPPPSKPLA